MRQTETHFLLYWRAVDALLASEAEPRATMAEVVFHEFEGTPADQTAASIIRQRIATARASIRKAA